MHNVLKESLKRRPPTCARVARLLLLLCGLAPALDAATIRGRVQDASSQLYLRGVEVRIAETGQQVFTERGGDFRFSGLAEGIYTLEARQPGYPLSQEQVTIRYPDEEVYLQLQVGTADIIELEAFEVSAGMLGKSKAMSIQRSADNLLSVISSDAFGEFVDRNPAEALQRMVGVSVQESQGEGRFVIVRGADPSLNTVSIDGVQVATPEEGGRSVGLNMIAIEQLESIELTKSWLPKHPPNFIGGAVNLVTRSALDREGQFMSLDVGYGKYTVVDTWSHRLNAVYGNVWGGDRVKFGLQVSFNRSMDRRGSETLYAGSWIATTRLPLKLEPGDPTTGFRLGSLYYDDYTIERERTGGSAKFELQVNNRHTFHLTTSYNRFNDDEVLQRFLQNPSTQQYLYAGITRFTSAVARQLGYDLSDPEVLKRLTDPDTSKRVITFKEAVQLGQLAYDPERAVFTRSTWLGPSNRTWRSSLAVDEIATMQFGGRHTLSDALQLDYRVHYSKAQKDDHNQIATFITNYSGASGDGNTPMTLYLDGDRTYIVDTIGLSYNPDQYRVSNVQDNRILSDDKRSGGDINAQYKWTTASLGHQFEAGLFYDAREKSYRRDYNRFGDITMAGTAGLIMPMSVPFILGDTREGFLSDLGDEYIFGPHFNTAGARVFLGDPASEGIAFRQVPNDITFSVTDALLRDYEATEDIHAAYLMHTLDYRRFRLIAGLRYEKTENSFTNNQILTRSPLLPPDIEFAQPNRWQRLMELVGREAFITRVRSERSYNHLLGALHGIYRHDDKLIIRSAVTQTIARPNYDDLVPREIPGVSGATYASSIRLPNFALKPLESVNYDLSADYYFAGLGSVSLGLFYKDLDGPIYTEIRSIPSGDPLGLPLTDKYFTRNQDGSLKEVEWTTERRVNAGKGKLYGLEFAFERKFSRLPGPLSGLSLSANFAIMESSVRLPAEHKFRPNEEVPLFLQPDKLANLSLSWEKYGFLVRASLLYKGVTLDDSIIDGERIRELQVEGFPLNSFDVYTKESLRLDIYASYRLRRGLSVYFEGINVTNEPIERYRGETWRLYSIRYTKPIYFAGVRWNF